MWVVFKLDAGPKQRYHIDCIRERSRVAWSTHQVIFDEDRGSELAYVTVAVEPDPPYQGKLALHAVFAEQAKFIVYWDCAPDRG
jgi:hypothetical protein